MFILARLVLSVILIFAPNLTRESQNKYHYKVLAQAVDETGRPVPYAYALIAPEQDNLGGDFMYSVQADALGRLRFELEDSNLAKGTRLLYVTGPMPPNAVTYITPPFNEYPAFAGSTRSKRRILIRKNGDADLGKIPINVSYGVVRVFLQDRLGKPLIMDVGGWEKVVV